MENTLKIDFFIEKSFLTTLFFYFSNAYQE
jgi:hypothetical protein